MKKSLVALAVLAASGAAMAQSSVTLYGVADVWVGSVKVDNGTTSTSTTSMISGGVSTSRWGMKGAEDLGGGLKAIFQMEHGFNVDTGTQRTAGSSFDRQAYVGLSGDFGAVKLGLISSPFDNVQGASDAVFDSDLAPANNPGGGVFRTSNDYTGKVGNTIGYESPNMSGFAGQISYSLAEDPKTVVPTASTAITSLALTYAAGPMAAQFAYQKEDLNTTGNDKAYTRLGASYNFGVATAKVSYGNVNHTAATVDGKTTEWQLGADFPVSATTTLSASYATSTDNAASAAAGVGEVKRSGFGIAAAYGLSKRTTVYGGFKKVSDDKGTGLDTKIDVFAVGVKHTF